MLEFVLSVESYVLVMFRTPNALLDGTGDQDVRLCKSDIALSFYVEVCNC